MEADGELSLAGIGVDGDDRGVAGGQEAVQLVSVHGDAALAHDDGAAVLADVHDDVGAAQRDAAGLAAAGEGVDAAGFAGGAVARGDLAG